jgi:hypothetical protein
LNRDDIQDPEGRLASYELLPLLSGGPVGNIGRAFSQTDKKTIQTALAQQQRDEPATYFELKLFGNLII